jgi:hypothetical protein
MTNKNMSGIYTWQRNRVENSVSLVKRAIDVLLSGRLRISLTTIVLASKSVDPAGKGVSAYHLAEQAMPRAVQKHATLSGSSQKKVPFRSLSLMINRVRITEAYLLAVRAK